MNKLALLIGVSILAGCNKKADKPKEPETGSALQDHGWVDRLPEVEEHVKLSLDTTAGLVGIKADGSIYVGKPPASGAAPLADASAAKLEQLVSALGITPVMPRESDAFATAQAADDPLAALAHPSQASGAPAPTKRATTVYAIAHPHDVTAGVVVFADAQAPAMVLIDVLTKTGGFVAVRRGQQLGALPLSFDRSSPPAVTPGKSWIEIRMGKTIDIENVPAKATPVESIDKLADSVKDATAVDVLVGPDTKVHELLTAIGKLRTTKVAAIGFGRAPAPGSPEASARGDQGPRVIVWDFGLQGQSDAAAMRTAFDSALESMRTCYVKALERKPDLAGIAQVQLLVTEKAGVGNTKVVEIPPPLVQCVTPAIKAAKYPSVGIAGVVVGARISFMPR